MLRALLWLIVLTGMEGTSLAPSKRHSLQLSVRLSTSTLNARIGAKLQVTLSNPTSRTLWVHGFSATSAGGPNLGTYLEIHLNRLVGGKKEEINPLWHRALPPIDDLVGERYTLTTGQKWTQEFERDWLTQPRGKRLEKGRYEVWADFDDGHVARFLTIPKKHAVGKVVAPAVAFEIVEE